MNILIAPDKFKGSLTAYEAAKAMAEGIREAYNDIDMLPDKSLLNIELLPMADGGDGSLNVVEQQFGGKRVQCNVHDPLGREIVAEYLLNGIKAFIEMAAVSGLELLKTEERNPLYTSTYGLGEAIKDACERGATNIWLSIGGSATNDCGAGMLQALGMTTIYKNNRGSERGTEQESHLITGADLQDIESVNLSAIHEFLDKKHVRIKVICDVDNPLLGPNGATYIYSPQKGADKTAQRELEKGIENFAKLTALYHNCGCSFIGAGAAGGMGYALHALLGAELVKGSLFFAELNHLDEMVRRADIVLTGEGCLDSQSFNGKVVGTVFDACKRYNKMLYVFCGISKLSPPYHIKIFSLESVSKDRQDSVTNAHKYIKGIAYNIFWGKNSNLKV